MVLGIGLVTAVLTFAGDGGVRRGGGRVTTLDILTTIDGVPIESVYPPEFIVDPPWHYPPDGVLFRVSSEAWSTACCTVKVGSVHALYWEVRDTGDMMWGTGGTAPLVRLTSVTTEGDHVKLEWRSAR
jgi:hypothetical protein